MNQLTRWGPIRHAFQMDPVSDIQEALRTWLPRAPRAFDRALEMRMDVVETEKDYSVALDMPGVRKEDIDVSVQGSQVTVRAEVRRETGGSKGTELHSERFSGEACRAFTLPQEVDEAKASAHYDGGVLTLTLPKKNGAATRHLAIQ